MTDRGIARHTATPVPVPAANGRSAASAGRPQFRAYTTKHLDELLGRAGLSERERLGARAVAEVLPFKANNYVVENLIDWSAAPDDPMYRLVFPQEDMLPETDVARLADLLTRDAPAEEISRTANDIRSRLNPHPAGQLQLNVPDVDGGQLAGVQHKYAETTLFFPRQGQTCHSYCTYCFRWAQFVGEPDLKMAAKDAEALCDYLRAHPQVTDVLFTGGDPMIMREPVLRRYVEPLLELDQIRSIRMGTKSLSYWPHKFVDDVDADDILTLFSEVVASGRHLAFMSHFSHPRQLEPPVVAEATRRIRDTGAVIRTQAPLIRSINDDPDTWATMWRAQVNLGMIPYYMFVERDTGPQEYFAVALADAHAIFRDAYQQVSGLARTVRGPSMSATPGKVCVDGVAEINGQKVFVLHMIQARDAALVGQPFFAQFDEGAVWLDDLKPAFADSFPFDTAEQ